MLLCQLSDQLGNQMFAYAAIKSIALDHGYKFGVISQLDNQFLKNDTDKKYGNTIISVFDTLLSGEILPQRKLSRTVTLRNISSEVGLIKYIFDVASFEEDLTNRV